MKTRSIKIAIAYGIYYNGNKLAEVETKPQAITECKRLQSCGILAKFKPTDMYVVRENEYPELYNELCTIDKQAQSNGNILGDHLRTKAYEPFKFEERFHILRKFKNRDDIGNTNRYISVKTDGFRKPKTKPQTYGNDINLYMKYRSQVLCKTLNDAIFITKPTNYKLAWPYVRPLDTFKNLTEIAHYIKQHAGVNNRQAKYLLKRYDLKHK